MRNEMKRFRATLLSTVLTLSMLVFPLAALASSPEQGSGTFVDTGASLVAPPRLVGGNVILIQETTADISGTFDGTAEAEFRVVAHPNGKATFQGTEVFIGDVDGRSGTVLFRVVGSIVGDSIQGRLIVLDGTGELEDLHAVATFEGIAGVGGTYSVRFHFDP